jgi:hypothetical protein
MRTRAALISMWLLTACGSKKDERPAGGSAAAGSAAVGEGGSAAGSEAGSAVAGSGAGGAGGAGSAGSAAAGHCIQSDAENVLTAFAADDKTATFCLRKETDEKGRPACTEVDLATGAYRPAAAPPARSAAAAPLTIKQDASGIEACKGAACKKLELPRPKVEDGSVVEYNVAVSGDGKRLAATGGALDGVVLLDGTTGKKLKAVKIASDDTCVEGAVFVGDAVYVETSHCGGGPGGSGVLYSLDGKKLGDVGAGEINAYGAEPIQVAGDRWALVGYGGGAVLVFDGKTGKKLHLVEIKPPEDCARCAEALGTAARWSAAPLAKLPSGKLATIDGTGVTLIDPETGKVERTHRMPICPAAQRTK